VQDRGLEEREKEEKRSRQGEVGSFMSGRWRER
jgi:hypothetical protein